jgi:hypothetical protein
MNHIKASKYFKPYEVETLYTQLQTAYNEAPQQREKDSVIFNEKTGKQTTKLLTNLKDKCGDKLPNKKVLSYPTPEPSTPKISFQAGSTTYTIENTKAHVRILAERLGFELVENKFKTEEIWQNCNGYIGLKTKKLSIVENDDPTFLPVYTSSKKSKLMDYFILFEGKMLYTGKDYNPPRIKQSTVIEIANKAEIQNQKISQALIDAVKALQKTQ